MEADLRSMLERELVQMAEPPLGNVAREALSAGRRRRHTNRVAGAGISLVGVGMASVFGAGLVTGNHSSSTSAAAAVSVSAAAPASAKSAPAHRSVVKRAALPAPDAVVKQVRAAVEAAGVRGVKTVEFLKDSDPDDLGVEVNLDGSNGPGMFRVFVARASATPPAVGSKKADRGTLTQSTARGAGGTFLTVGDIPANCIQRHFADSWRPGGVEVLVSNASCLAWNGTTNVSATPPLSRQQMVDIASSPQLGAAG